MLSSYWTHNEVSNRGRKWKTKQKGTSMFALPLHWKEPHLTGAFPFLKLVESKLQSWMSCIDLHTSLKWLCVRIYSVHWAANKPAVLLAQLEAREIVMISLVALFWLKVDLLGGNLHRSITWGKRTYHPKSKTGGRFDLSLWLMLGKLSVQDGTIKQSMLLMMKKWLKESSGHSHCWTQCDDDLTDKYPFA